MSRGHPGLMDRRGDGGPPENSVCKIQPPKGGAARSGSSARGHCEAPPDVLVYK